MANRSNNIWAKAAAGSPGTNIARAQQSRWTGIPNEAIMRLVEDKIGGMLEGISDATGRNAAASGTYLGGCRSGSRLARLVRQQHRRDGREIAER